MSAQVVTCSKAITLHSLDSRQPLHTYTPHRGNVNGISINHTNKVIASCGQDGKVFLVTADKPENKLLQNNFYPNPKEKPSPLSTCAFSPNSKYLAVGSQDNTVKVWDLRGQNNSQKQQISSQLKAHMSGITSLAWIKTYRSENIGSDVLASSSSNGEIMIHSHKSGAFKEEMTLKLQEGINCIRVSQSIDNNYCRMAACTNGGTLAVWDLLSGKDKPTWMTSSTTQGRPSMTSLSISPYTPILLVTSSVDETLTFFDIQQKKSVKKIVTQQPLSCVGLHSNGHTLVAGGMYGGCFVYDLRNPSKPQNKLAGHQSSIKHLQFFKVKEKESSHMSGQIKGKAPSIANPNSSSSISYSAVDPKHQNPSNSFPGQAQIKSKQNIKLPQPKKDNFMNSNSISQKSTVIQQVRNGRSELSSTAQQLMRNNNKKSQVSQFSEVQSYHRNKEAIKHEPIIRNQVQTSSKYEVYPPSRHQPYESYSKQSRQDPRQLSQKLSLVQNQLKTMKQQMFQMQQRITLSMTRQFQLQYTQFKSLLSQILIRDKQKQQKIKKLQSQNQRLKNSTY